MISHGLPRRAVIRVKCGDMVSPSAPTAAILVIGEEVLTAKVTDENSPYLLKELRKLGVAARRVEVLPDVVPVIAERVRAARLACDYVFTSGGVGPTHDDVTIAGVAAAFDVPVVRSPAMENTIRELCAKDFHERDLRMADIPEGAELVYGEGAHRSPWPVVSKGNVFCLPGVPSILRRKFAMLRERFSTDPFFSQAVYSRLGEGAIAHLIDQTVAAFPDVSLGSYPHLDRLDHKVMITLDGRDATRVEAATTHLVGLLGNAVTRVE
jgi:molybdenum cofactor synthesis domain-containing protein